MGVTSSLFLGEAEIWSQTFSQKCYCSWCCHLANINEERLHISPDYVGGCLSLAEPGVKPLERRWSDVAADVDEEGLPQSGVSHSRCAVCQRRRHHDHSNSSSSCNAGQIHALTSSNNCGLRGSTATSCCISDAPSQWKGQNFDPPQLPDFDRSVPRICVCVDIAFTFWFQVFKVLYLVSCLACLFFVHCIYVCFI